MILWWSNLSVSKKLYVVVGAMAILIAAELLTLYFAMNVLSAVRSFVGGEGLWSKAQKNAVHSLHRYAFSGDPAHYENFLSSLEVNHGDRQARLELERGADYNAEAVFAGFVRGQNHPEDVPGLIYLIENFRWISYIKDALKIWREADELLTRLEREAEHLHTAMQTQGRTSAEVERTLQRIDLLNEELTRLEAGFSQVLGVGSRWLERTLMLVLILTVLTVEGTGLFLTFTFSRTLSRTRKDLTNTTAEVGRRNLNARAHVGSGDELGQLAASLNTMIQDLSKTRGARRRAESASQVKSEFLAYMSHEIRTPVGVIKGLAEVIKDRALPWTDHLRYAETIERTAVNLTRIINDVLDLSKVEAGHLDVVLSRFELTEFIQDLSFMLQVKATQAGNRLEFIPDGETQFVVETDRTRLRQILLNLVNNALKFTEHGTVQVHYRVDDHRLVFEVHDTGRGIAADVQPRVFEAFMRAAPEGTKEGTGLGLMLSKRLAQALGGDVVLVRSELGKGSVFRVEVEAISVARADTKDTKVSTIQQPGVTSAPDAERLSGREVLVVEDAEDNQLIIKLILARKGIRADFAANGVEALQKAFGRDYAAVLMDMQMPVMDGYRATRELRDRGFSKPVIAFTAHAMKEDRQRCLDAGCDDYLTKPLDSGQLFSTLARHIR